ncbi:MAG: thioredoxin domain-containing protein, partial [Proteobacteria bacterium]|nr:thioredoxin domain-containing protein [Pseudomonadota bacterium]
MKRVQLAIFIAVCAFAAGWAYYLIGLHHQAKAALLQPGLLCGPEKGCEAVLASEYGSILGIPVSTPAVPLYVFLATLGIVALFKGPDSRGRAIVRLAVMGLVGAILGAIFGGWLLFHMVVSIGEICGNCLVMDGANIAVLVVSVWLLFSRDRTVALRPRGAFPGAELALAPVIAIGTAILVFWGPEAPLPAMPQPPPLPSMTLKSAKLQSAKPQAVQKGPLPPKTKRLVLGEKVEDIPIDSSIPFRGPSDAPVTILLFEDFQCPFCKTLASSIEALIHRRDDVRVGFVHFPMHGGCNATELRRDMHKYACGAATAAVCAQKQGK